MENSATLTRSAGGVVGRLHEPFLGRESRAALRALPPAENVALAVGAAEELHLAAALGTGRFTRPMIRASMPGRLASQKVCLECRTSCPATRPVTQLQEGAIQVLDCTSAPNKPPWVPHSSESTYGPRVAHSSLRGHTGHTAQQLSLSRGSKSIDPHSQTCDFGPMNALRLRPWMYFGEGVTLHRIFGQLCSFRGRTRGIRGQGSCRRHAEPLEARVLLTTFSVVNTEDSGAGSLRSAIAAANANSGVDAIEFSGSLFGDSNPDVITLTSGRIEINDDLQILGPGADLLTVSAGGQSQLFFVSGAATDVTIDGLSLADGDASGNSFDAQSGGAIYNDNSSLTLSNIMLTGSSAAVDGGGLYNQSGTVTVTGSTITNNSTGRGGGGLASNGLLTVTTSDFSGNSAPFGGAIAVGVQGTLDLQESTFSSNSADVSGAGVFNYFGSATITDSLFEGNVSVRGGTVTNSGDLLLTDSTFVGNTATYGGGAANSEGGTAIVLRSTFTDNLATRDGGGLFNSTGGDLTVIESTFLGNEGTLVGGGVANVREGTVSVLGSTMSGNTSNYGGAIANIYGAEMTVANSTISANVANNSGGGVLNDGLLSVTNSTIVLNLSNQASGGGGGLLTNPVAGVETTLNNTLVAGNVRAQAGSLLPSNVGGKPVTGDSAYNLIGAPGADGGLVHGANGNIVGAAGPNGTRVLLPVGDILDVNLIDNGGPTLTHALLAGSVAIDAGSNALAVDAGGSPLAFDQRGSGFPRIAGTTVDIGAFEF